MEKKNVGKMLFIIGGLPLVMYPFVLLASIMGLGGQWSEESGFLIRIIANLFYIVTIAYLGTYILCLTFYFGGPKKNIIVPIIPLVHLAVCVILFLIFDRMSPKTEDFNYSYDQPIVYATSKNGVVSEAYLIGGFTREGRLQITDFVADDKGKSVKISEYLEDPSLEECLFEGKEINVFDNESFKFYSFDRYITKTSIPWKNSILSVSRASGQPLVKVFLEPFKSDSDFLIGINEIWNALPDIPKQIAQDTYSINLDGVGEQEIVKVEKDLVNNRVRLVLSQNGKDSSIEDGCYYEDSGFNIIFLDINGDGKLETITNVTGAAGGANVYSFDDGCFNRIFSLDLGE